jgi:hypothetical protein
MLKKKKRSVCNTHLAGAPDSADAKILDSVMATAAFSPINLVNLTLALLSPTVTAGPIIVAPVNSAGSTLALLSPMATAGPIIKAQVDSADSNLVLLSPKILNINSITATAGPVDVMNKDQRGMQLCAHFNCNDPFLA